MMEGRSVFIEWPTLEAAAEGVAALIKRETFAVEGEHEYGILGFAMNGITHFIAEGAEGEAYSVYFSLDLDDLTEDGRAKELAFIAAAEATGGEYTGS